MKFDSKTGDFDVKYVTQRMGSGSLIVDDSYQRRSVWIKRDKIRLIESVLNSYLIPPIYFWDRETDPKTGDTFTHIVDGQQRITALSDYIDNSFKLESNYLSLPLADAEGIEGYQNKYFEQLSGEDQVKIWNYQLTVITLGQSFNIEEIRAIFVRLNLTDYSLNHQEKRHAGKEGLFSDSANDISTATFWEDNSLFTSTDMRRMGDVQFCASLLLLARRGIVNESTQTSLNKAYDDYKEDYPDQEEDKQLVFTWMELLHPFVSDITLGFLKKKTQLYSMFCLMDYLNNEKVTVTELHVLRLEDYVVKYNSFKNEGDNSGIDNKTLNLINIHKLAASEGIRKLKNRQLRLAVLKSVVLDQSFDKRLIPKS